MQARLEAVPHAADRRLGNKRKTMAFVKGKSGNPSGRPKIPEGVKELAKAYTEAAIQTLGSIMSGDDQPAAARVKAAECLLDRAWGKSESTVNVKTVNDVRDLSTAEILAALAANGIAGSQAGSDGPGPVH